MYAVLLRARVQVHLGSALLYLLRVAAVLDEVIYLRFSH